MYTSPETRGAARNFANVARYLAAAKGDPDLALALAERTRASEAVRLVLRTGVPAQTIGDVYTEADAPFAMLVQAFMAALVNAGAFDRIAQDAVALPFRTRLGVGSGVSAASLVDEGAVAPMQAAQLTDLGPGMVPLKVVALTVLTAELAKVASTAAVIERELRNSVALGTDRKFLADLVAVTTPITSAGLANDIDALLDAVTLSAVSRPFFVFSMSAAKKMVMARSGSALLFPDMTISGGEIAGIPTVVSDGLPSDESGGSALICDAAQLAVNRGEVGLDVSDRADVELQSAPSQDSTTSTPAELISMWSSNLVGIKTQRTFAYAIMRDAAVASLSGVSY